MNVAPPTKEPSRNQGAAQEINWENFRDHLATADKEGHRQWIYARKPAGRFYRWRSLVSWLLLGILFVGPFVRIHGNPLLMLNIVERRFSILGHIFWPQDMAIFAVALLLYFMSVLVFTTAFGRLWCGWTCPQTLLMEMVFRKIEYLIDGDTVAQKALAASPWTKQKVARRLFKHATFFALSFLIANTLLSYVIGVEQLLQIITDDPRHHLTGLGFLLAFTFLFYLLFARFREQACTFICPYGRLQSAVVDENTLVVAYDHRRGEKRSPGRRNERKNTPLNEWIGDCVDCHACVAVCPTGIDIRNGTQMECVNCTACIDACDSIMQKIKRPGGLIRYASLNSIEKGEGFRFTGRMVWYSLVLGALASLLVFLIFTRSDVEATLLRAPGALFQRTTEGRFENLYTLKVVNKTSRDIPLELKLENITGTLRVIGAALIVPKEQLAQTSVLIDIAPENLISGRAKLTVGIYADGRRVQTLETVFIGPRPAEIK
jgi:cytochrome c oxidase accessory protein FixG